MIRLVRAISLNVSFLEPWILSGVARVKQLCSRRQGNGFVVYASLCNVCKNMNLMYLH